MNSINHDDLDMQQITAMLETAPHIEVPDDFATRVMAQLPRQRRTVLPAMPSPSHYGEWVLLIAMAVLIAGTVIVAPLTRGSAMWFALQIVLVAQLVAFVVLFGLARRKAL